MLKVQATDHMGSITSNIGITESKSNQSGSPLAEYFISFWARIKFLFSNAQAEACDCSAICKGGSSSTETSCFKANDDYIEEKSCRLDKLPQSTDLKSDMFAPFHIIGKDSIDVRCEQSGICRSSETMLREDSQLTDNCNYSLDTLKPILPERLEPTKIADEGFLSATLTFSHSTMISNLAPETYSSKLSYVAEKSNVLEVPRMEEADVKKESVFSSFEISNGTDLSQSPTILGRLYAKLQNSELTTVEYEKLSSSVIASTIPRNLSDSDETRKPHGANQLYAWQISPHLPRFDLTQEKSSNRSDPTNPDTLVDFVISDAVRKVCQCSDYVCTEEAGKPGTSTTHQSNCFSFEVSDVFPIDLPQADDMHAFSLDRVRGSLKSKRSYVETPCRKIVRFADSLGLDLATVRQVKNTDHPPSIPASATIDLNLDTEKSFSSLGAKQFQLCFPQPGVSAAFMQRVLGSFVCLENARVDSSRGLLTGTIRVRSIGFEKNIYVRITYDNWSTYCEVPASYVQDSHDGTTDRFAFSAVFPSSMVANDKAQFAVRYETHSGVVYWDNNHGENYVIHCCAKATDMAGDGSWIHFL